ncbi:JAB domain-containing protein [Carnobacterium inhibens]|uniref:JAB domain-containing protein n=1 Tax=Carnobacterium inhibens TaxID=147709 RepID=UPI001FD60916|nr:JAB domain-containing protein [Carnobacterium inhibens]
MLLLNNGAIILLFDNHPSGNLDPYQADLFFTDRIADAGEILGIELLDHIIVNNNNWYSFNEHCHF